jgi:hypothetical protein
MYTFRAIDFDLSRLGIFRGKIMNPWWAHMSEIGSDLADYRCRFRGALLRLFGPPSATSSLADESFNYMIEATDEEGSKWVLTAYDGPSGPAIGGNRDAEGIMQVVDALVELIESTPPADFEATVYDDDLDWTVTYGCRDGNCYYHEVKGDHRK